MQESIQKELERDEGKYLEWVKENESQTVLDFFGKEIFVQQMALFMQRELKEQWTIQTNSEDMGVSFNTYLWLRAMTVLHHLKSTYKMDDKKFNSFLQKKLKEFEIQIAFCKDTKEVKQ